MNLLSGLEPRMRKKNINKLIKDGLFNENKSYTRRQFTKFVKTIIPNAQTVRKTELDRNRADMALLKTQGLINKELHKEGLHLKSLNYFKEFYIVGHEDISKEITRYAQEAKAKQDAAIQLKAAYSDQMSLKF